MGLVGHVLHRQGHEYHLEPIPHFHVYTAGARNLKQQSISQMLRSSSELGDLTERRWTNSSLDLKGTNAYFFP